MPIEVVGSPTVRESDGLALSSRNTRLSSSARHDAPMLSAALFAARDQFSAGERDVSALTTTVRRHVAGVASISIEYVEAADTSSARVLERIDGPSFLALAADIGGVRLIDNVFLDGRDGTSDVGVQIKERSILYGGESCS
jgi:pantoate--beta-alanine ligase